MSEKKDETFDILFSMKNQMDRFFSLSESGPTSCDLQPGIQWTPALDLFDCGNEYRIIVELPGVEREAIDLSVYRDKVVVKGRREEKYEVPGQSVVLCLERVCGRFEREVLLPDPVDTELVKAALKDGLLTVLLNKKSFENGKKNIAIE